MDSSLIRTITYTGSKRCTNNSGNCASRTLIREDYYVETRDPMTIPLGQGSTYFEYEKPVVPPIPGPDVMTTKVYCRGCKTMFHPSIVENLEVITDSLDPKKSVP